MNDRQYGNKSRRRFLTGLGAGLVATSCPVLSREHAPAFITSDRMRPVIPYGVATGDTTAGKALIWSKCDRSARMVVQYGRRPNPLTMHTILGPVVGPETDFTAKLVLEGLPPGSDIFYRVRFQDPESGIPSLPEDGQFRAAGGRQRNIRFQWSGDICGQGYGINPDLGGMTIFRTMELRDPDFFICCGGHIYADGLMEAEQLLPDGTLWRNVLIPEKTRVAETLDDFRGNYRYNLLDGSLRSFNARVAQINQWDDHEVHNNWYPGEILTDPRYGENQVDVLARNARQAFFDYLPINSSPHTPQRIYRRLRQGPLLDIFVLDMRSYRGPNGTNDQALAGKDTALLGETQLKWLMAELSASKALWKVVTSDMPLGLVVGKVGAYEAVANGNGPVQGREHEIARLLKFIKDQSINNLVFLTADVHYTAAHHYHPDRAQFQDFNPFWEFVSGPLNAGTFGPSLLDDTFGPEVVYQRHPPDGLSNLPPSAGFQFFGEAAIDAIDGFMTVTLLDMWGTSLFEQRIEPMSEL